MMRPTVAWEGVAIDRDAFRGWLADMADPEVA